MIQLVDFGESLGWVRGRGEVRFGVWRGDNGEVTAERGFDVLIEMVTWMALGLCVGERETGRNNGAGSKEVYQANVRS